MIVVDTNIIFSTLVTKNDKFLSVLLNEDHKICSPYFLFIELYKHKERIAKYSKVDEQTLLGMLEIILSKIQFIPISMLSKTSRKLAYDLCKDIDEKDSVFVALTLEYHGLLWTGDKKLISGLKEKGFNRFFQI